MKTTTHLRKLASELAREFTSRFYDSRPDIFPIGNEPLGTWAICDEYWDLEDMALALDSELTPDELRDWYWETVDRRTADTPLDGSEPANLPLINLKSYIMGARYDTRRD